MGFKVNINKTNTRVTGKPGAKTQDVRKSSRVETIKCRRSIFTNPIRGFRRRRQHMLQVMGGSPRPPARVARNNNMKEWVGRSWSDGKNKIPRDVCLAARNGNRTRRERKGEKGRIRTKVWPPLLNQMFTIKDKTVDRPQTTARTIQEDNKFFRPLMGFGGFGFVQTHLEAVKTVYNGVQCVRRVVIVSLLSKWFRSIC